MTLLHNYLGASLRDYEPPEGRCSLTGGLSPAPDVEGPTEPKAPKSNLPSTLAPISLGWGWPCHLYPHPVITSYRRVPFAVRSSCTIPFVPHGSSKQGGIVLFPGVFPKGTH